MDFYEVLEKRRTYRDFSDREVSDEILKRVIGAAFKAPTNDHLRQLEFVVVRSRENIAKVIAPLAENMAAFKELVAEVDESGDKDKMAMFADALPKQQKMLMQSSLLIIPFFRQQTQPLLKPGMVCFGEYVARRHRRGFGYSVPYSCKRRSRENQTNCERSRRLRVHLPANDGLSHRKCVSSQTEGNTHRGENTHRCLVTLIF